MNYIELKICESTQDIAYQKISAEPALGHIWVRADSQTLGRGRQQKTWCSLEGNLFLSGAFVVAPSEKTLPWPLVSLWVGRAVAQTLKQMNLWHENMFLKWPNDIFYEDSQLGFFKLGGILCEKRTSVIIIGVGLNVEYAPNISNGNILYQAQSLKSLYKDFKDQNTLRSLSRAIAQEITQQMQIFRNNPLVYKNQLVVDLNQVWMRKCWGQKGLCQEKQQEAEALGLNAEAALQVKLLEEGTTVVVNSGEFHLLKTK